MPQKHLSNLLIVVLPILTQDTEYNYENMGLIYSTNSSLYALFSIVFLIVPQFYSDIHILGITINIFTVLVGFYLLFINNPFKESKGIENEPESYAE